MTSERKKYLHYEILGNSYPLPLIMPSSKTKEYILIESTILFARKGFAAVSMRELAEVIGIKPASLYNHFGSKEELWQAVIDHAHELYLLYFRKLDEALVEARDFYEIVDLFFVEAVKMSNLFTCYAFCLIQSEQFRDERAAAIFNNTFLEFSIKFIQGWFDKAVQRGWVKPFDTLNVASIIMHAVLNAMTVKVQETMGRPIPYDPSEMMAGLKKFVLGITSPL